MQAVRAHKYSSQCVFDRARRSFVYDGRQRRGLTRVLDAVHAVPRHSASTCGGCARVRSTRAQASAAGFRSRVGPMFQSRKRQRAGDADLIVVDAGAPARRCKGRSPTEHGRAVDRDLEATVRSNGQVPRTADPCTLSLLAFIEQRRWRVVGTQVPIYSPSMDVATAIDVVCVDDDDDDERWLHVVEVKSTRTLNASSRACYEAATAADGEPPLSRYAHHQWQLWAMVHCLRVDMGIERVDGCVLRTSPTGVDYYPLNPWFASNARRLCRMMLATRGGGDDDD